MTKIHSNQLIIYCLNGYNMEDTRVSASRNKKVNQIGSVALNMQNFHNFSVIENDVLQRTNLCRK